MAALLHGFHGKLSAFAVKESFKKSETTAELRPEWFRCCRKRDEKHAGW
jgi:hypothetical protein